MSKHQDKENEHFDDFIRRKLEDHPMEFNPAAWEAMEKKLDKEAGRGGVLGQGGKVAGLIALLIILSLTGWLVFSEEVSEQAVSAYTGMDAQKESYQVIQAPADGERQVPVPAGRDGVGSGEAGSRKSERFQNPSNAGTGVPEGGTQVKSIQELSKIPAEEKKEHGEPAIRVQNHTRSSGGSRVVPAPELREEVRQTEQENGQQLISAPVGELADEEERTQAEEDTGPMRYLPPTAKEVPENEDQLNSLAGAAGMANRRNANNGLIGLGKKMWEPFLVVQEKTRVPSVVDIREGPEKPAMEEIIPEKSRRLGAGFPLSISLSMAPDFTGTKEKGSNKFGAGAGLFLEYEFLPKWTVISGAFYSTKNYLADNSFSPYGKFWDYRPSPDYIDASCGVLDIPLNLRYYVRNGNRHRLFLSAGTSSYIMKREDYTLVYNNNYYQDYTYSVDNENRHLFAVYNFSLGYQRSLSPHWFFQVEPFMKIPAKGVGIGAVKLNSMGAFLSMKYRIGR